ncbi:MAG: type I-E CRISPR-associated protein Cas7/Cse4/CasC [Magnetococcales bacterium]|nr:type I-E CRISPR-associated protein Cas7/Cse4/CasC [Magnetococcales bacterium]
MNRFLQLHLLTSYPPANLNRDDLGRPKSAVMGGALRLRVSSQSLKRAWRTSSVFATALKGHVGTRTKEMGRRVYQELVDAQVRPKDAKEWAGKIAGQFGKLKKAENAKPLLDLEIEQLAHFSPAEEEAIRALVGVLSRRGSGPAEEELKLLREKHSAADIGLFGRMLADAPAYNTEAAAQVAHAIAVHRCQVEDDFFTAVDDLNDGREERGSGHMGETEFGAALFYLYACIDLHLLKENLQGDQELLEKTLRAFLECAATVAPTGKQNSFASRAYASYILAEKGDRQPRSLSVAFLKPVTGGDPLPDAIDALELCCRNMDQVYGPCATARQTMNAHAGSGSLTALQAFVSAE